MLLLGVIAMRGRTFALIVWLYFCIALVFSIFYHFLEPFPSWGAAGLGAVFGGAIFLFVASAIVPMIGWAFGRFRLEYGPTVLIVWALLEAVLGGFSATGQWYDRDIKITRAVKGIALGGKDREDFLRSARLSCFDRQKNGQLNRQLGVTDQQIVKYCACYADELVKVLTVEDLRQYASVGRASPSMQEKIDRVAPICSRLALGR